MDVVAEDDNDVDGGGGGARGLIAAGLVGAPVAVATAAGNTPDICRGVRGYCPTKINCWVLCVLTKGGEGRRGNTRHTEVTNHRQQIKAKGSQLRKIASQKCTREGKKQTYTPSVEK